MKRLLPLVLTAALMVAVTPASPATAATTATSATASTATATQVLTAANTLRTAQGQKALTANTTMTAAAQARSKKLAAGTATGMQPNLLAQFPAGARSGSQSYAVNIASNAATVARTFSAILTRSTYTHAGIGITKQANGRLTVVVYVAQYVTSKPYTTAEKAAKTAAAVKALNATRAAAGKKALAANAALTAVAQKWADTLASGGTFKHNPNLAAQVPKGWRSVGENIAYSGASEDVKAMNTAWAKSPPHYKNMIGDFTRVGIAFARSKTGYMHGVQVFAKY